MHIATVIYYLTHSKDDDYEPASHFNKVLIDVKNDQAPNRPHYVTSKRKFSKKIKEREP